MIVDVYENVDCRFPIQDAEGSLQKVIQAIVMISLPYHIVPYAKVIGSNGQCPFRQALR